MTQSAFTQLTLAAKRAAFPLAAPRYQTLSFWPVTIYTAAVDGYFEAFFAVMAPRSKGART